MVNADFVRFGGAENFEDVHFARNNVNNLTLTTAILQPPGKHIRLRPLESETEHYLKALNVPLIKLLVWVQAVASLSVFVFQILLLGAAIGRGKYFKPIDFCGIGIWGPVFIFGIGSGLTWISMKYPTGLNIGTAVGFQIANVFLSAFLLLLAVISLIYHGRFHDDDLSYDPEVAGRIFSSFMIVSGTLVFLTSIFISVHLCRSVCCRRQRVSNMIFDIVTVK